MKEFEVFSNILDILMSTWVSMKGFVELTHKYDLLKCCGDKYEIKKS
jgi:hypothetical protein